MWRLGVVSFLNSKPLIEGLDADPEVDLRFAVPAQLPAMLQGSDVGAALIPVVDVLRSGGRYVVLSNACIGADGETMTVRVFSQVPPDRVRILNVDSDSHTSVALARVLWRELYNRDLTVRPIDSRVQDLAETESVLLIGDKVVDPRRGRFAYEVDLAGAWRQHTGLPFVFAVWACPRATLAVEPAIREQLGGRLNAARDRGVARAAGLAEEYGPSLGWPVALAHRYLVRCLRYNLDGRAIEGVNLFAKLGSAVGVLPADAELVWASALLGSATGAVH